MHIVIDDSDTLGRTDKICLGALLGRTSNLEALSKRWDEYLQKHQLPYLHATDFMVSGGIYRDLPLREDSEKIEVVREFAQIINDEVDHSFVSIVDAKQFREILFPYKKRIGPQEFCFARVCAFVNEYIENGTIDRPISFLVDDSSQYTQRFLSLWQWVRKQHTFARERVASICFADDRHVLPIQAADLFARCVLKKEAGILNTNKGDIDFGILAKSSKLKIRIEQLEDEDLRRNLDVILEGAKPS